MAKKRTRFYWTASRAEIDGMPTDAALDMLRYDRATVEGNPPEGRYLFSSDSGPTPARWRSFGVSSIDVVDDRAPGWPTLDLYEWPQRAFYDRLERMPVR